MVCRTRLGDQGRIGPSRWTVCGGAWPPCPWIPEPPAQPSPAQPAPAQDRPVSVLPQADAAFRAAVDGDRRRVEFALTEGRGGWAGRRASAPAHKTSVIGQPCALQQPSVGSIEVPGYNDAGVQTECLLKGRVSRRRCHRSASLHGQQLAGAMSTHRALLSRGTVVGLDGAHGTHWEWSGPTPGSLAGRRAK